MGLDHYANGNINVSIFNKCYGNETTNTQLCNIIEKSSLNLYQSFVVVSCKQLYLSNVDDFRSTRLNILARTNCLPINATLQRMNLTTNNECQLRSSNAIENIFHVMLDCPSFSAIRKRTSTNLQACFDNLKMDICFSELSSLSQIQVMIDDLGYLYSPDLGNSLYKIVKKYHVDVMNERSFQIDKISNV